MKKRYVIYMKNGEKFMLSQDKYEKLAAILTQDQCPSFVGVEGNIINTASIAMCAIEDDPTW